MVDLKGQYNNIKTEIDTAIQSVIDNTAFINGSAVSELKKELAKYLNVKHVITCGNGTDALQVALMSLDLSPGDEVITPDFTFIATVEAISLLGLTPVLADIRPDTFTIDIEQLKKKITPRTKAIIPVHLFGQAAEMEELLDLAQPNNIAIIEDNAQAFGASYTFSNGNNQKLGTIGTIGCTSFFPSKNLGCYGDGGAIFTNDDALAEKLSALVNHGSKKKYYHEMIGVNSRLDTIQAAILNVKLKNIDSYNAARKSAAQFYNNELAEVTFLKTPTQNPQSEHVFHQYTLVLEKGMKNTDFQEYLKSKSVPSMIYYPQAMHQQQAFGRYVQGSDNFPVSELLCSQVISLPMHTELDAEQLEYIVEVVKAYKG